MASCSPFCVADSSTFATGEVLRRRRQEGDVTCRWRRGAAPASARSRAPAAQAEGERAKSLAQLRLIDMPPIMPKRAGFRGAAHICKAAVRRPARTRMPGKPIRRARNWQPAIFERAKARSPPERLMLEPWTVSRLQITRSPGSSSMSTMAWDPARGAQRAILRHPFHQRPVIGKAEISQLVALR
jgi:hypothetical protein